MSDTVNKNNTHTLCHIIIGALAALLVGACVMLFIQRKQVLNERDIAAKERYTKIYQAEELDVLKKKNKEFYLFNKTR